LRSRAICRPVIWLDRTRLRCSSTLGRPIHRLPRLLVVRSSRPVCGIVLWLTRLSLTRLLLNRTAANGALPPLRRCSVNRLRWFRSLSHRYWRLSWRRSNSDRGHLLCRRRWLNLSNLRDGQWLAAIALYRFLPSFERRRWRWWRSLGYNRALLQCWRRLMLRWSCRSQHSLLGRHDRRRSYLHLRPGQLPFIHSHRVAPHRLRRRESLLARRHYSAWHALVHVSNVVHRGIVAHHRGLVIVVYDRAVDGSVGNVHVFNIPRARSIRRHIHFTRSQREPTD
jgi:hypothetical protein